MRTFVTIKAGRWRNRVGWIAGELDRQNPATSKVLVHVGDECEPLPIVDLAVYLQLELPLPGPKRSAPPATGQRRNYTPW